MVLWGTILVPLGTILVPLGTILVPLGTILVPLGHPMGHLGGQMWILIDFLLIWGLPWAPCGGHFGDIFVN